MIFPSSVYNQELKHNPCCDTAVLHSVFTYTITWRVSVCQQHIGLICWVVISTQTAHTPHWEELRLCSAVWKQTNRQLNIEAEVCVQFHICHCCWVLPPISHITRTSWSNILMMCNFQLDAQQLACFAAPAYTWSVLGSAYKRLMRKSKAALFAVVRYMRY